MLGVHLTKAWPITQPNPAFRLGEAEYHGVVEAAGTGLGNQALLRDLRPNLPLRLGRGSSASLGVTSRRGAGKIRHLDTRTLLTQQGARTERLEIRKAKGNENPAELFAKHLPTREKLEQLISLFNSRIETGRAQCAPKMGRGRLT